MFNNPPTSYLFLDVVVYYFLKEKGEEDELCKNSVADQQRGALYLGVAG